MSSTSRVSVDRRARRTLSSWARSPAPERLTRLQPGTESGHRVRAQREEGVASRRLIHPHQIRARQIEAQPFAQQMVEGAETQRTQPQPPQTRPGEATLEVDRNRNLRCLAHRQQDPHRFVAQAPQRHLQHAGGRRVQPLQVINGDQHRPCTVSTPSTSSTAKPMACGSETIPPGSSNSNATSNARRRGGTSDANVSASTGANSSDNPANDSDDSASTPRHVNTRPKHRSAR